MSNEATKTAAPVVSVKAFRVYAWRCPGCNHAQFSERSGPHTGQCKMCAAIVTVRVPFEETNARPSM
jgi:hypothetical protein